MGLKARQNLVPFVSTVDHSLSSVEEYRRVSTQGKVMIPWNPLPFDACDNGSSRNDFGITCMISDFPEIDLNGNSTNDIDLSVHSYASTMVDSESPVASPCGTIRLHSRLLMSFSEC
jgi:hypothetical protein